MCSSSGFNCQEREARVEGLSGQYLTPNTMHEAVEVQLPVRQLGEVEEWRACTLINKENYTSHIKLGV